VTCRIPALLAALMVVAAAPTRAQAQVVVLDPGHGGTNRGASSLTAGIHEKKLTLAMARGVAAALLRANPRLRVVLTRSRDLYLTLQQRVRGANKARARLFVSLHFNASPYHTREGFETFILSRAASSEEAAALASRENRGESAARGQAHDAGALRAILSDLHQSAAHAESLRLARRIQGALRKVRGKARDLGVRQAGFDVLRGLSMPGVLVEAGFIDHPREGKEMLRDEVREAMERAVAQAILAHLAAEERVRHGRR